MTLIIVLTLIYFTIKEFNSHRTAEAILQENYKELENLNQMGTEKNWLLSGMSIINDNLQDITDVTSLNPVYTENNNQLPGFTRQCLLLLQCG